MGNRLTPDMDVDFTEERMRRPRPAIEGPIETATEMRVVRQADIDQGDTHEQWTEFLDELGHNHYGKGAARSIGSMAVVYVSATEMGQMLGRRFSRVMGDPNRVRALQRRVAVELEQFMQSQFSSDFEHLTAELEATKFRMGVATGQIEPDDLLADLHDEGVPAVEYVPNDSDIILYADLLGEVPTSPDRPPRFHNAKLEVNGIKLYGKDGFGIDLSGNEQLYVERDSVVDFLAGNLKVSKNMMATDWEPHATVFTFEQHRRPEPLTHQLDVPPQIEFEMPRPIIS